MAFTLSAFSDEIDMDLNIQMDELEKNGIQNIEIRGVNGKNISEVTLTEAHDIKASLDARGFKISSIGSPIGKVYLADDFQAHKATFCHLLEVANILNAKYMRVFSFFMADGADPDDSAPEVVNRLTQLADLAAPKGITLLHENEKEIFGDTAKRCLTLATRIDRPNFKLCFDPANFVQCGEDTNEAFSLLEPHVVYHHIKDYDPQLGKVVPAGAGDGNIAAILKHLFETGYHGYITLEPHLGNFMGLAAHENTDEITDMEQSDGKKFAQAADALKAILCDLGVVYN